MLFVADLTEDAKLALRNEIQLHLQSIYLKWFFVLSVFVIVTGLSVSALLTTYVTESINDEVRKSISNVSEDVLDSNKQLTNSLQQAEDLEKKVKALSEDIDKLTSTELSHRINEADASVLKLKGELEALKKVLVPDIERLYQAKKMVEDATRIENLKQEVTARVDKMEDRVSDLQFWIWGTLLLLAGGALKVTYDHWRESRSLRRASSPYR